MYPSAKWLTIADELRANFSSMFMFESASQALLFLHSDGERGADEKRGENEIEGEGRKEKGWRVRRGEERSEGKSEEGESEAFTHSG